MPRIECVVCHTAHDVTRTTMERRVQALGSVQAFFDNYMCRNCLSQNRRSVARRSYRGNPFLTLGTSQASAVQNVYRAPVVELSKLHDFTFGIEFENGMVTTRGITGNRSDSLFATIRPWNAQHDGTAGFEIVSPVFNSIETAFDMTAEQFKYWKKQNTFTAPYPKCNSFFKSMGNHIHLGLPQTQSLNEHEKREIVERVMPYLPMMYFISANDTHENVLSQRMLNSSFCKSLAPNDIMTQDHSGADISDSLEWGTIEFRSFDANFPQVTLACAHLLKSTAELNAKLNIPKTDLRRMYLNERARILSGDITTYLKNRERISSLDVKIPNIQALKEVFYITFKLGENPARFIGQNSYNLCNQMFQDVTKYCDNVIPWTSKDSLTKACQYVKSESEDITSFKELVSGKILIRSKGRLKEIVTNLKNNVSSADEVLNHNFEFKQSWLNNMKIKTSTVVRIYRLHEIPDKTPNEAAKLIADHIKNLNAKEITESSLRFYYMQTNGEFSGYIVMSVPDKTITTEAYFDDAAALAGKKFLAEKFNGFRRVE